MSSSESERDYDYEKISKKKRKREDKDKYRDKREKSHDRHDKYYDKYTDKYDKKDKKYEKRRKDEKSRKKRERSRSLSSSSSGSSRRDSCSSKSRKHKNKNDKKQKTERRKRKYEDEIEELKERELKKKLELENKRKLDEERIAKEKKFQEEKSKQTEKALTEEEKQELKKQTRLARARALALIESAEEKKSEVLNNKNVIEDFLDKDKEMDDFFKPHNKIKLIDEIEKYEIESADERDKNMDKEISNDKKLSTEVFKEKEGDSVISIGINNKSTKLPQLPKEFLPDKERNKLTKEVKTLNATYAIKPEPTLVEEEDPLDAFMKSIEKEATLQEYQVVQYLSNESLQKRYDEIAQRDGELEDEIEIQQNNENEFNYSKKVITLDDILKQGQNNDIQMKNLDNLSDDYNNNDHPEKIENQAINNEDEEEFHKAFVESLKKQKVPEYDPLYGYSYADEKKDSIIYQEDFSEFLKEDAFVNSEDAWQAIKRNNEKVRELKAVNHSQINYEHFRKSFYIETKEITNMTDENINKFRKEHGDIKVRGKNIPKPIFNWYQCGLSEKVIAILEKKEFKEPFPIQCQAIPCIMSGRDIIGIAETGSGKTLAYVLPMIRHVMDQRKIREGEGPIGLILAPTRELATQIHTVVKPFAKIMNLHAACVYGGAGIGSQISELRRGAEIAVCTPGRMIEMLCLSNGKITNLQRVRH
jgi:ATP-dependent RNA helicase DDX46/PRP5